MFCRRSTTSPNITLPTTAQSATRLSYARSRKPLHLSLSNIIWAKLSAALSTSPTLIAAANVSLSSSL